MRPACATHTAPRIIMFANITPGPTFVRHFDLFTSLSFAALRQASFHGKRTRTRSGPLLSASWPIFNFLFIRACRFQRRQATLGSTPSVGVATSVSGLLHVGNSQHRTNLHRCMALSRLWRFSLVPNRRPCPLHKSSPRSPRESGSLNHLRCVTPELQSMWKLFPVAWSLKVAMAGPTLARLPQHRAARGGASDMEHYANAVC